MKNGPISFPGWKTILNASGLSPATKASHAREIIAFLHHCKKIHSPASVKSIKQWLPTREKAADGPAHLALRWFYREGTRKSGEMVAAARPAVTPYLKASGSAHSTGSTSSPQAGSGQTPPTTLTRTISRPMEPPPAASDKGEEPWEKALIKASRERVSCGAPSKHTGSGRYASRGSSRRVRCTRRAEMRWRRF